MRSSQITLIGGLKSRHKYLKSMKDLKITRVQPNPVNSNDDKDITAYIIGGTIDGDEFQTELIRHYYDETFYLNGLTLDGEALKVRPGVMSDASDVDEKDWGDSYKRFRLLQDNQEFTHQLLVASASFENLDDYATLKEKGLGDCEFSTVPYICPHCVEETIKDVEKHYIGKEISADDLWNGYRNEDFHTVKVVRVEHDLNDGGEFIDLILDKEDVLVDRATWLEEEFAEISGFPDASFTEIGMMREGALRFAVHGW